MSFTAELTMMLQQWVHYYLARFHLVFKQSERAAAQYRAGKIIERVSDFDPIISRQLIREIALAPHDVESARRAEAAPR